MYVRTQKIKIGEIQSESRGRRSAAAVMSESLSSEFDMAFPGGIPAVCRTREAFKTWTYGGTYVIVTPLNSDFPSKRMVQCIIVIGKVLKMSKFDHGFHAEFDIWQECHE